MSFTQHRNQHNVPRIADVWLRDNASTSQYALVMCHSFAGGRFSWEISRIFFGECKQCGIGISYIDDNLNV